MKKPYTCRVLRKFRKLRIQTGEWVANSVKYGVSLPAFGLWRGTSLLHTVFWILKWQGRINVVVNGPSCMLHMVGTHRTLNISSCDLLKVREAVSTVECLRQRRKRKAPDSHRSFSASLCRNGDTLSALPGRPHQNLLNPPKSGT